MVYGVPFVARGSLSLVPERLTAYEVGWSGEISDEIGATAAFYINRTRDAIDFTDTEFWSGANPPPGWNEAFHANEPVLQECRSRPASGLASAGGRGGR